MNPIGSPNNIEVLLHCYISDKPHPRIEAPAVRNAISFLHMADAIWKDDAGIYRTTSLGTAWIKALCRVPRPKPAFVDELGRVIT